MLTFLRNTWKTPDLRNKILFTLAIILLYRILAHIPMPGANISQLRAAADGSALLGLLNLFSGGGLSNFSIAALGLSPFITASIIIQLLTMAIPHLEELSKEGESGQNKINRYTRILTVPLAIIQGISVFALLRANGLVNTLDTYQIALLLIVLTAGTMLVTWMGELITEKGIGNGVSILIFAGILAGFPTTIINAVSANTAGAGVFFILAAIAAAVIAGIVYITEGERPIPVQYASKVAGNRTVGGQSSYIPVRVNQAGVIPIIFASSLVTLPLIAAQFFVNSDIKWLADTAVFIQANFSSTGLLYGAIYFLLVLGFAFFYSTIAFNPERISEDLQKRGGFVPGIRPGAPTKKFLQQTSSRITLIGGLFLAAIAVLPLTTSAFFPDATSLAIGGTSLLIIVSVILETAKQIQAMMVMRNYEGFLR